MTDKWYSVPIASRVEPFLQEHADRWYTIAAIAGEAHLVPWQVQQQLAPLVAAGKVTEDRQSGYPYYRWAVRQF